MNPLWVNQDYIDHLSHPNYLVRRWAFKAISERYRRVYTPEVARLIGDDDEHLACVAPKYMARHSAVDQAPAILESFQKGKGNVPSNCAIALGDMHYEPAVDAVLERLTHCESTETLLGILYYLGKINREDCHQTLRAALDQLSTHYYVDIVAECLLEHNDPEDVPPVFTAYFSNRDQGLNQEYFLERLMNAAGARGIYNDLTRDSSQELLEAPESVLDEMLEHYPILNSTVFVDKMVGLIDHGRYQDLVSSIAFDARGLVRSRYPAGHCPEHLRETFDYDTLSLAFLEEFAKRSMDWKQATKRGKQSNLVSAVLACYFSIHERGGYLSALNPEATLAEMIAGLKDTGREFPRALQEGLARMAPIEHLKDALSSELNSWGDIWTVRLMGRIGSERFVPDLLRVVRETDGLSHIHEDAIDALHGVDESGHAEILSAIQDSELSDDWDAFALLEHLPYSESFDLAQLLWNEDEMDSYEIYASALEGIGDVRGIEALREIFFEGNASFIGNSLEVLSVLHDKDIPELAIIRRVREEDRERRRRRSREMSELVRKAAERTPAVDDTEARIGSATVRRQSPKVGRNAPCPCGSGKKYKKCCLNN